MAEPYRRKYLSAGTLRLSYLEWGEQGPAPIVFLHGIGDNAHIWEACAEPLSRGKNVIALDQRGHGLSGRAVPPDYSCEAYVGDLAALADELNLSRIILVGHSMGALHALAFAAEYPHRVAALVHADIEATPPEWNKEYLAKLYHRLPEYYTSADDYVEWMKKNAPHADEHLLQNYALKSLKEDNSGRLVPLFDREVFAGFDRYDLEPRLADIACPALVIRGAESRVMRRWKAGETARLIPDARFVEIKRAAHPVHIENPGEFRKVLQAFLRSAKLLESST